MVNGRDESKLKVPRRLANERRERLVTFAGFVKDKPGLEFLGLEAAALYLSSFKWSWHTWWGNARFHAPHWLEWAVKLVDRDYAALCRQVDAMDLDADESQSDAKAGVDE